MAVDSEGVLTFKGHPFRETVCAYSACRVRFITAHLLPEQDEPEFHTRLCEQAYYQKSWWRIWLMKYVTIRWAHMRIMVSMVRSLLL